MLSLGHGDLVSTCVPVRRPLTKSVTVHWYNMQGLATVTAVEKSCTTVDRCFGGPCVCCIIGGRSLLKAAAVEMTILRAD